MEAALACMDNLYNIILQRIYYYWAQTNATMRQQYQANNAWRLHWTAWTACTLLAKNMEYFYICDYFSVLVDSCLFH
jgi:hypothetical protein